ncbi:MAG: alpha-galactosidase [candidate division KSB1 bacterium]|nr:alpha-galactosidase [candidate division KSB1 bacterium]MDZ7357946.1 alpha-galactosidase [candidate division KSB1 bacterium]MDZ7400984.1 alpha-galactosidase [candidate division KSB1 bacterium]
MHKIVFIGAGSLGFTRGLVRDLMTFPILREAEIALVDIDAERLEFAKKACEKIIRMGNYPARVTASLNRRDLLKDADAVLVTILCGDTNIWQHDILIPMKYGIDINVGDTRGPSGIFRALRTIPTMLDICRDMEELCPNAILLNYTNPMAMLCHAMQRESFIKVTGLCHSVQGTAEMLARWMGVPFSELNFTCAGINHLAWFIRLEHRGKDLYPRLREVVMNNEKVYNEEQVRNEMFLALGYYVTESSGHNSEYNWWFRKRPDLIEKYCTHGTGWNPGHHAFILNEYRNAEQTWKNDFLNWLNSDHPISLERGHEYAAYIINAYLGGELYEFNGNVPNTGLVTNLPEGACVEVPVLASRKGFEPIYVGRLPDSCAILTNLTAQTEMMAVEGFFQGDAMMIYQAIAHDPLTAAKLSLAEIRNMVREMFEMNREYLPQFKLVNL